MTTLIGFDYETHLIGPGALAPKPVCLSVYVNENDLARYPEDLSDDAESCMLATRADEDMPELEDVILAGEDLLVGANVAFDLAVMGYERGDWTQIFGLVANQKVSDIQVREKLLNLAQHGNLSYYTGPDGSTKQFDYSLGGLAYSYLGVNMSAEKSGDDAWRTNYDALEDLTVDEWPDEAVLYAINDSIYPTLIWRHQEDRREELIEALGVDPLKTEHFRVLVRLSLYLMSCEGVRVDPVEHSKIVAELHEALRPEKLDLLVEAGILRPGKPPTPYANGAKAHVDGCSGKARKACDCPPKMKGGTKDSVDKKAFEAFVMDLRKELGPEKVDLRFSEKGNLRLDKEFLTDHAHLSPVLTQYRDRQTVMKLVSTDMPRMEWPKGSGKPAEILHANFDFLKETGRTSSYASKLYPSWNCQNPHPRVRACIIPREGYVFYSVDYSGMELGTLAQKCYSLFGFSVLRDVINKGWDAHAYLGAYLAYYLDDDFREAVLEETDDVDGDQLYKAFKACADSDSPEVRKFYKHYRTFAKPTGLGYPGGLGPKTFVQYAHATYGIECDETLAGELREVWHKAFPEMSRYLDWINSDCEDPRHPDAYAYLTPMGMYRANASYCAAANGAALQSPSAEGALLAVCSVSEATYADVGSVLYPDAVGPRHRPLLFIHDELIGEARVDVAHEVAHEVSRLMVESMSMITPDVQPKAEPVLMTVWDKRAEPVYENGRLVPWKDLPK